MSLSRTIRRDVFTSDLLAWRSPVVRKHDWLRQQKQHARSDDEEVVNKLDLFSLSPQAIVKFISDSLKHEDEDDEDDVQGKGEVQDLAEAVYAKTMGNIFFTKQALEELVRKNILFYDVIFYRIAWYHIVLY